MATATEERTIIETKPGYFKDPGTNRRTSKRDGDRVVSQADWDRIANGESDKAETKAEPETHTLSTGQVVTGPVKTIRCKKRGCDNTRVIKVQDGFQVKFCLDHQKENRNELRRQRRAKASKK